MFSNLPKRRSLPLLLRPAVALALLAIMLLPAEVWRAPASDFAASGFDPETQLSHTESAYVFDPFVVVRSGTWDPCPCPPDSRLAVVGQDLAKETARNSEGALELAGTSVMVDGKPAELYLVSPSQVHFLLPPVEGSRATIDLMSEGESRGRQVIGVQSASSDESRSVAAVSPDRLLLTSSSGAEPAVHLLTTPLSFNVAFDVTILEQTGSGRPLQAMVWNPRNFGSVAVVFGPSPNSDVAVEVIENRGDVIRRLSLGRYRLGEPYRVEMELHRARDLTISVSALRSPNDAVTGGPPLAGSVSLTSSDAPGLFTAYRPSVTVVSSGKDGSSAAALTNYRLELPHERFTTVRVADARTAPLVVSLVVLGLLTYAYPAGRFLPRAPWGLARACRRGATGLAGFVRRQAQTPGRTAIALALGAGFVAGNAYLFGLGSHPFDMTSQKIWAYLTTRHGMTDLYYAAQVSSLADVWNGMPFHEAVFPYGPAMAYYFGAIGHLHQLFFGSASPEAASLGVMIKSFNLSVAVLDGALIYALVRAYGGRPGLAWIAAGLLLLNPAVIFDISVWGETEPVPLFFLLSSLLAARRGAPTTAWALLGVGALTKQTILVAVLVLAVYYLRSFDWRANLKGCSAAVFAVAAVSLPFVLDGYAPSVVLDPTLAAIWVHGSGGAERVFQVVSYDAFNLWTLLTPLEGVGGLSRLQYPDYVHLPGEFVTYRAAGAALFGACLLGTVAWLLVSRRAVQDQRAVVLAVAFVLLAQLMLPTESVSRYFLFPAVLAIGAMGGRMTLPSLYVVGVLSVTCLLSMMGSVGGALEQFPHLAPSLAPDNNVVMEQALRLYRSDATITAAAALNVSALIVAAGMLVLPRWPKREPATAVAYEGAYVR